MIINNPQEYFVIVRSIPCSELGLAEDRCYRNEETPVGTTNAGGDVIMGGAGSKDKTGNVSNQGNMNSQSNMGMGNMNAQNNMGNMSALDNLVVEKVNYFFFKIADLCSDASMDQVYTILKSIYTSLINAHINNVPCFAKVKNGEVKGLDLNTVLKMHLDKFKKQYEYHVNKFACGTTGKSLNENTLNMRVNELDRELDTAVKQLVERAGNISTDEVVNLYILGKKTVIGLLIKYVPCFNKAVNGVNGMSLDQIANIHYDYVRNKFKQHVAALKCDK